MTLARRRCSASRQAMGPSTRLGLGLGFAHPNLYPNPNPNQASDATEHERLRGTLAALRERCSSHAKARRLTLPLNPTRTPTPTPTFSPTPNPYPHRYP